MSTVVSRVEPLFGLLELDAEGMVLYYNPEKDRNSAPGRPDIVGQNLFRDVALAANVREFQDYLNNFWQSRDPARSLNFTFDFGQKPVAARVLLARIHERSELGGKESILVHIRRAS